MQNKIKIILVDDHAIVREGFKLLLELTGIVDIVCECENELTYKKALEENIPDIVLMDIRLPGVSGIELCKYTSDFFPVVKVIITSSNTYDQYLQLALKAGCKGFVSKNCGANELLEAIKSVYNGKPYFSKDISESIINIAIQSVGSKNSKTNLTARELDIIRLLCEGKDFNTIGTELSISSRTVESHKKNILSKLNLNNTIELVKFAIKENLIED